MRFDNASIVVYYCLIQMNIINLGILAHIDAGKTSVTENLLFASGATEKGSNNIVVFLTIQYYCLSLRHE